MANAKKFTIDNGQKINSIRTINSNKKTIKIKWYT